jgi:hypothetical protein
LEAHLLNLDTLGLGLVLVEIEVLCEGFEI